MPVAIKTAGPTQAAPPRATTGEAGRLDRAHARGPLRPSALSPVRTRMDGAMLRLGFRVVDALALTAALGLMLALGHGRSGVWPAVAAGGLAFFCLPATGGYAFRGSETVAKALLRVVVCIALVAGAFAVAELAFAPSGLAALAPGAAVMLAILALTHLGALFTVRRWRRSGRLTPNILVVGATENAQRLIETALATREVAVLGVFDDRSDRIAPTVHGVPVLGDTSALLRHHILPFVDRIVLTVNAAGPARTAELIERLRVLPNELCLFIDAEDPRSRTATMSWLSRSALAGHGEGRVLAKRAQDLVLGSLLLVGALPVMAVVALLVRLDSPGPVLFRQRRHGFNNEEILVWKFRSMRTDATDDIGARQVTAGDERVTRIGRFIRKTSLDELPQLINVLQGRMSLVGPRPHPIGMKTAGEDSARLVAEYAWRHRMKPGITGWAQINGSRGPVSTAEAVRRRVELDVDYIERQSFAFDLYIIAMTLPCLLGDRHAVR